MLFDELIGKTIQSLVERKIILEEDKTLYFFGIRTMIIQFLHMVIMILMGVYVDLLLASILFLFAYMPLRVNAGGYHAPNNKLCFGITIVMDAIVLAIIKFVPIDWILPVSAAICLIFIPFMLRYAPVENAKKPLDLAEKEIYGRRTKWMLSGIFVGICLFFLLGEESLVLTLALSILAASSMIFASLIQNMSAKEREICK